jgi:hypothetical protein
MLYESCSLFVRLLRGIASAKPNFCYGIFCLSSLGFAQIPCIQWQLILKGNVWTLWLHMRFQLPLWRDCFLCDVKFWVHKSRQFLNQFNNCLLLKVVYVNSNIDRFAWCPCLFLASHLSTAVVLFSDAFKLYRLFGAKWEDVSKRYIAKDVSNFTIFSHSFSRGARVSHEVTISGLPPEVRR